MSGLLGTSFAESGTIVSKNFEVRAYMNFAGTFINSSTDMSGVRDSFNCSSCVEHSKGNVTINFTAPMGNVNYVISGMSSYAADTHVYTGTIGIHTVALGSCRVNTSFNGQTGGSIDDAFHGSVIITAAYGATSNS